MSSTPMILVINCGSSSIKFAVMEGNNDQPVIAGLAERLGAGEAYLSINKTTKINLEKDTHEEALNVLVEELHNRGLSELISAIGHRVAHGGDKFDDAVLIDDSVIAEIESVSSLAPLHNYANLMGISAARRVFPTLPQVAVFDTAFHQTLKPEAYVYALPYRYLKEFGVRRYGFHGTSHRYITQQAIEHLNLDANDSGIIVAHLGNGSSICAVENSISADTSMGMTPLEGLVMGTRSGDVDFGALAHIAANTGKDVKDLEAMVNKESGLLGISELSSDLRTLQQALEEGHAGAKLAIDVFVHRLARHIGGHATSLKRLDAIIFTGGIGENSALIRELTLKHLAVFGFELDEDKNNHCKADPMCVISKGDGPIAAVIPTNEEKMIALDTIRLSKLNI